jgi:hypothetical protein
LFFLCTLSVLLVLALPFVLNVQHTQHKYPCPGGIRTRNPSRRAAADPRLRPLGHWDRQLKCKYKTLLCVGTFTFTGRISLALSRSQSQGVYHLHWQVHSHRAYITCTGTFTVTGRISLALASSQSQGVYHLHWHVHSHRVCITSFITLISS